MPHPRLRIPRPILEAMRTHARAEHPNECCGLLAGPPQLVTHHFPLVNVLASPVVYEADPRELLSVHRRMRELGIEEVAIYHSHPSSAPIPSSTDLARNGYGASIPHLIIGPEGEICGWWLHGAHFEPATWDTAPD